ncbi:MFS transporter (plasmid) [Alicyclobacillus fastidiosus]|uniref:MFS transporter n=1 Tax=Alicyclobacillus fastidiosus TaxID=392011 RepID=A0ABY6ZQQ9_9BACL|nr:MFS transporter [Alicyclobacillus fastidiosus]WAH44782.1 MFS transporter [Alicyclobacillus fastidiosus]GMA65737.1 MFS transporter [Alicyclobacillus fastidiosus]GMA65910.1 MFS transporter [Alicyclobacillus fastidiosus]
MGENKRIFGLIPRGASKYSWLTLLNTWITWGLNVVTFAMVYVIGSSVIKTYHLSPATWGWLVAGYLGLRFFIDIPLNLLSDRLGSGWKRKFLWFPVMIEYSIIGAMIAFPALSSSVWSYFALMLGIALGTSASEAIGVTATAEWWSKEERGFAVGLHHTGYPVGAALGGAFASFIFLHFGADQWRLVYLASLATIPFAIWYWFLSTQKNIDQVYQNIDRRGLTRPNVTGSGAHSSFSGWMSVLKIPEVSIAAICLFLFQAVQNVFMTSFPEYLSFVHSYSYAAVASLSVVWSITGAIFQFLWPAISDKIGRKWLIVGAGFWQAVIMILLLCSTSVSTVILVQLLYGVTANAVFPLLFTTGADIAPANRTGAVLGVGFAATWLGAAVGSIISGQVLQRLGGFNSIGGYHIVFYTMIVLSALTGVVRLFGKETNPIRKTRSVPMNTSKASMGD